jgi:hypothetical protein
MRYRLRHPLTMVFLWRTRWVYARLARRVVRDIADYARSGFEVAGWWAWARHHHSPESIHALRRRDSGVHAPAGTCAMAAADPTAAPHRRAREVSPSITKFWWLTRKLSAGITRK